MEQGIFYSALLPALCMLIENLVVVRGNLGTLLQSLEQVLIGVEGSMSCTTKSTRYILGLKKCHKGTDGLVGGYT